MKNGRQIRYHGFNKTLRLCFGESSTGSISLFRIVCIVETTGFSVCQTRRQHWSRDAAVERLFILLWLEGSITVLTEILEPAPRKNLALDRLKSGFGAKLCRKSSLAKISVNMVP